jgi:hypothetical protein
MKELIKYISEKYKKVYTINEVKGFYTNDTILVNVTRKDNGFTFDDNVRLDIDIKQIIREEKLNQLGIS